MKQQCCRSFGHFLVKSLTAKHVLSPLNEVHKENVQWGGQFYPPYCEFTRLKIFDKLLLINLGNARPLNKFSGKLWFSSEWIQCKVLYQVWPSLTARAG